MSNSIFKLSGKIIAFSGATGVLGEAMSRHLAKEGATILILGRNEIKIKELIATIESEGGKAEGYLCDVTDEDQVKKAAEEVKNAVGSIDILINAAGGNMPGAVIRPDQNFLDLDVRM